MLYVATFAYDADVCGPWTGLRSFACRRVSIRSSLDSRPLRCLVLCVACSTRAITLLISCASCTFFFFRLSSIQDRSAWISVYMLFSPWLWCSLSVVSLFGCSGVGRRFCATLVSRMLLARASPPALMLWLRLDFLFLKGRFCMRLELFKRLI
jgi:hypothetical protein